MMQAVLAEPGHATLLEQIYRFRYHYFVDIQGVDPPGVDHQRRVAIDSLDDVSLSFALIAEGDIVGSLRLTCAEDIQHSEALVSRLSMSPAIDAFGRGAVYVSSRFILEKDRFSPRGMFRVMELAYRTLLKLGCRILFGDCSSRLTSFYKHMGYRVVASDFVDPFFGAKTPLVMLLRDREWFRAVGSPVARLAAGYPTDGHAREWFIKTYGCCRQSR